MLKPVFAMLHVARFVGPSFAAMSLAVRDGVSQTNPPKTAVERLSGRHLRDPESWKIWMCWWNIDAWKSFGDGYTKFKLRAMPSFEVPPSLRSGLAFSWYGDPSVRTGVIACGLVVI